MSGEDSKWVTYVLSYYRERVFHAAEAALEGFPHECHACRWWGNIPGFKTIVVGWLYCLICRPRKVWPCRPIRASLFVVVPYLMGWVRSMSGLTRDETAKPRLRDPLQLTTTRIGNYTRLTSNILKVVTPPTHGCWSGVPPDVCILSYLEQQQRYFISYVFYWNLSGV